MSTRICIAKKERKKRENSLKKGKHDERGNYSNHETQERKRKEKKNRFCLKKNYKKTSRVQNMYNIKHKQVSHPHRLHNKKSFKKVPTRRKKASSTTYEKKLAKSDLKKKNNKKKRKSPLKKNPVKMGKNKTHILNLYMEKRPTKIFTETPHLQRLGLRFIKP